MAKLLYGLRERGGGLSAELWERFCARASAAGRGSTTPSTR